MKRSDTKPSPGGEGLATAVSDSPSGSNHSFAKSVRALHTSAQHAQELTEVTFMSDKAFNRKYPEEDRAHIAIARDAKRRVLVMEKLEENFGENYISTFREMPKAELQKFMQEIHSALHGFTENLQRKEKEKFVLEEIGRSSRSDPRETLCKMGDEEFESLLNRKFAPIHHEFIKGLRNTEITRGIFPDFGKRPEEREFINVIKEHVIPCLEELKHHQSEIDKKLGLVLQTSEDQTDVFRAIQQGNREIQTAVDRLRQGVAVTATTLADHGSQETGRNWQDLRNHLLNPRRWSRLTRNDVNDLAAYIGLPGLVIGTALSAASYKLQLSSPTPTPTATTTVTATVAATVTMMATRLARFNS